MKGPQMGLRVSHLVVACPRHANPSYRVTAKARKNVKKQLLPFSRFFLQCFIVEMFNASHMTPVGRLGNNTEMLEQGTVLTNLNY